MSRRKQAKPKSTRRSDEGQFTCEDNDSDAENSGIIPAGNGESKAREPGDAQELAIQVATDEARMRNDGEDDERESTISEGSTSETPPTPTNGLNRHECVYCDASFGSLFLLKQHEQESHAHLMPFKCKFCGKGFKHKRSHDRHEKSHSGIRKHKCAYCGQAFFRSDHLKLHLKTHETSKYPFVCILCQRGFHSSSGLESHMQIHEKHKYSAVNESQAASSTDVSDTNVEMKEGEYGIRKASPVDLDSKIPTSNPPVGQSQCSVCSATFKTPESLLRHMDNDHRILKSRVDLFTPQRNHKANASPSLPRPSLSCHYCYSGDFYSEEALELHLQALHGVTSNGTVERKWTPVAAYNCGICGQSFSEIGSLQKHTLHSHTLKDLDNESSASTASRISATKTNRIGSSDCPDPTYECQTCGRTFDSILALHGHASNAHGSLPEHVATPASGVDESPAACLDEESNNGTKRSKMDTPPANQLYQCGQCEDVVFNDLAAFSAHMSQHIRARQRPAIVKSPSSSANSFQEHLVCDMCGLQLASESARDDHVIKHYLQTESQYCCKSCGKSFAIPDELQKHLLDMHAIHLYRCSLCKELFESRVDIQVHFAVSHSDEIIQFRCRSCNAVFSSDEQFGAHVRAVHLHSRCRSTDNRSHSQIGDKSDAGDLFQFPSISAAGSASSFCCPFCGDAFTVEYLYEKHLENAHRAEMEMFMLNEFIPKASVSQLLAQAVHFKTPVFHGHNLNGNYHSNDTSTILPFPHASHQSASSSSAVIKCNICDRRCETMLELAEHKLQHCKVIHSQICNFCHEQINSIAEFHAHTRQHNSANGIPMACIICKQSLVSSIDMQAHAKFHLLLTSPSNSSSSVSSIKLIICQNCGKEFASNASINQMCSNCDKNTACNKRQESPALCTISKCRHCNLKFETAEERNQHESEEHQSTNSSNSRSAKPYQCIKCQKSFATELEIQAHVTTHVLQDGIHHYCMLCKKVFDSPSKLQCHLIEHSFVGCSELQCYLCNAIFALPQPLQQHMLTKHGIDDRPYECRFPQCEQKFFFRAELENHSLLHQMQQVTKPTIPILDTAAATVDAGAVQCSVCPMCAVPFTNNVAFNDHLAACASSLGTNLKAAPNSDECDPTNLTTNEAAVTSNSVPRASQQERRGSTGTAAQNGRNGDASGANLHYCPHCGKGFQSLSALQGHSHVHMVSKTHQCTKCRKVFPTAAKLRNHQRQHSGDKPFPCTMCMRFFSRKDNLKVHMRIHYKQSGSPSDPSSSPGITINASSNLVFPTMVPRSSSFVSSLPQLSSMPGIPVGCLSTQRRSSVGAELNERSSDGSTTPFEHSNSMMDIDQENGPESVGAMDGEQSCHANED